MNRIPLLALATALLMVSQVQPVFAANSYEDASKLFKQGNYAGAMERVETVIAANPRDARARFLKGLILTEQNKPVEAIKVFTALTEDYPELPEPYNNLAVLYASQGQYDKARNSLEMAIRTHPSYAIAHENLGDVYAKMASEAYDKALQLDRSNAAAQTKLAMIKDLFTGSVVPGKGARDTTESAAPATTSATALRSQRPPNPQQDHRCGYRCRARRSQRMGQGLVEQECRCLSGLLCAGLSRYPGEKRARTGRPPGVIASSSRS